MLTNPILMSIDFKGLFEGPALILLIIFLCSLVATTIFIERLLFLRRSETDINDLVIKLRPKIQDGNIVGAVEVCESTPGAISRIILRGLTRHNKSSNDIEQAMEVTAMNEIAKLEKNAKILSLLAHVAPLIGLLGTVLGFIQAFSEMRLSGLADISATRIGEAMEYALITTAAGLAVAIPCVIAYNYIVSRIEAFVLDMKTTSHEVVDMLSNQEDYGI
jgi:biopolymer transport protein ExbB